LTTNSLSIVERDFGDTDLLGQMGQSSASVSSSTSRGSTDIEQDERLEGQI
jgi:hypothetical protein